MPFKRKYSTPEESKAVQKEQIARWEAANAASRKKYQQDWYLSNKAAVLEKQKLWAANNKDKVLAAGRRWVSRNLPYCAEKQRRRVARLKQLACVCCLRADLVTFYSYCPSGFDVDHIIPLAHNGPHCLKNLRYLPSSENRSRGGAVRTSV